MKKEDRRVTKSKMRIREGLLDLLEEKPLSKITVIELTERAKVNRKTFYNHYSGVYEVVNEMEDECIARYKEIFSKERVYEYKNSTQILFEKLINEVVENEDFYRVMSHNEIHLHFSGKLADEVKVWLKSFKIHKENTNMEMLEYFYDFITAGTVDVVHRWLNSENQTDPRELAGLFNSIVLSTEVKKFFQLEENT